MKRVPVHEVKAHFASIVRDIEAGEIVVVTRHDKPIVEMRAITDRPIPKLGAFADPQRPHCEVSWSEDELREVFGDLGTS